MNNCLNVLGGLFDRLVVFVFFMKEYVQGVGITDIDMRMANVRDGENKCSFTLTTPYRAFR